MEIFLSILLTFLFTLANGYFSMSEMALVSARRANLERDIEDNDDKRAKKALDLSEDSTDFLATIQVAITLVGFFSATVASTNLSEPLANFFIGFNFAPLTYIAPTIAPILITLIVSFCSIVIGELVPKRIALSDADKYAKAVAGPITAFKKIARPLVLLTGAAANALSTLLNIKSADDRQNVSEEEIKYMVNEQDSLLDEEKRMIHEIFDLGDTCAREVMIPRVDMTMVEDDTTLDEVLELMRESGYSRIPIYHEDPDEIVGIAHIKDIISPVMDEHAGSRSIREFVHEADFVPDTKDILPLLSEMQSAHDQMVIVVDEYGGTAGVITIEDIVEEIVGEIEDEFDPDNKYLTAIKDNSWLVDGRYSCDDAIELGWPIAESDEYETIAGWILDYNDCLPEIGDVIEVEGWHFKVQSMRGQRIALIRVTAPENSLMESQVVSENVEE